MNHTISDEALLIFWAKTPQSKEDQQKYSKNAYHPLLCHLLDVAAVAQQMWAEVLSVAARRHIARSFNLPDNETGFLQAGKLVSWIAGLHDLGKASPPFTLRKSASYLADLYEQTCPQFSRTQLRRQVPDANQAPHGFVTTKTLPAILSSECGMSAELAEQFGILIGGHHGIFPLAGDIKLEWDAKNYIGTQAWADVRSALVHRLATSLGIDLPLAGYAGARLDHATMFALAGLVSVADWIGSNSSFFPYKVRDFRSLPQLDWAQYLADARAQARRALHKLGWLHWTQACDLRGFQELFQFAEHDLRTVQTTSLKIAAQLDSPGIVIVEAPMGEGKTEAAMFLADQWNVKLGQRGIYFALPTQATSNQMFLRVQKFLRQRFADENVLLQLLHGHAALSAEFDTLLKEGKELLRFTPVFQDDGCCDQHRNGHVIAAEWFTHRKRGLLAPYGVGTVDQALMAILQTRHAFVRLFGLAHKTVIIDEVHAYDAYMSTLLERLLEWLAALRSPVILLSATLPKYRRERLLDAYARGLGKRESQAKSQLVKARYPLITWETATAADVQLIEPAKDRERDLQLRWLNGNFADHQWEVGALLQRELAQGGCAAVICNTVDRAQEVYRLLSELFPGQADDGHDIVDLLHARFLFKDRAEREHHALVRFGKEGEKVKDRRGVVHTVKRPDCAILVATQIIEQSLDLDFDLIITDLAPVDLLLQRAGREWRHQRDQRGGITAPVLWVCRPEKFVDGVPDFKDKRLIYDPHVLLRSWLALTENDRQDICIPAEVEALIEAVYDDERACPPAASQPLQNEWRDTKTAMVTERELKEQNAKVFRILSPHAEDLFSDRNFDLEEDSPDYYRKRQAATRDEESPSISVVLLKPEELFLLKPEPDIPTVRALLERSVNIVKRGAANDLIAQPVPDEWEKSAWLRHHRLLRLDAHGRCQLGDWVYRLDDKRGVIIKTVKQDQAITNTEEQTHA